MTTPRTAEFVHVNRPCGVELAADVAPARQAAALCFRMLVGAVDEPPALTGVNMLVERTLSKGTARHDGRGLADAFDALGAQWGSASGRQSTLVRVVCLPEFVRPVIALVAELLRHPTFPDEACRVALELAQQDLRQMQDDPQALLRVLSDRLTYGPVLGRPVEGTAESLARITPADIRAHWQRTFAAGRLQVAAAGPGDVEALGRAREASFAGFGTAPPQGRAPAEFAFVPAVEHQHKELQQQYIGLSLPGRPKSHAEFAVEQVLLGVLSGGMSGRLFTEVREKQGLVYWVGAWHEQPRGCGVIRLGASTTPERCDQTYATLRRELARLADDVTETEVRRAQDVLSAHHETEDDLTRARAAGLSDDLFHFSRPVGLAAKLAAIRAVDTAAVAAYAGQVAAAPVCVATLGPRALHTRAR